MSIERFAFDLGTLKRDLEALGAQAPLVMARALNRAILSGQTAMVKTIGADTGIAAKNIKREIRIDKAQRTRPVAAIEIVGRRIPLIAFSARGPEPSRGRGRGGSGPGGGRGRGVSYRLLGGRGRISNAFIATMPSGHRGVFRRKTKRRLAIFELHGPSIPHVFEKHFPVFRAAAEESLLKNLASEISFARG